MYCGKELALFKRLRGGEFCSDAHRQRYQEEYTQLALSRLAQVNAAQENESDASGEGTPEPESPALKRREKPPREEAPSAIPAAPAPVTVVAHGTTLLETESGQTSEPALAAGLVSPASMEPITVEEEAPPEPSMQDDEPAPAEMAGFLVELPVPSAVDPAAPGDSSEHLSAAPAPALPRLQQFQADLATGRLYPAERVAFSLFTVTDFPTPPRERGLELRDFVRGVPQVEIQVKPAVESGFEPVKEPLEVNLDALPPGTSPALWLAPEVELAVNPRNEVLLGDLARLDFSLTEWGEAAAESEPVSAREPASPLPAMANRVESVLMEPVRHEPAPPPTAPEPVHFEPVHIDPVFMERIAGGPAFEARKAPSAEPEASTPSATEPVPDASVPEPVTAEPAVAEAPIPSSITRPLPMVLHGLAPARGKPVQVFTSATLRAGGLQIPREAGLPLRPVMVLAPAPKPAVEAAPEKTTVKPVPAAEKPAPKPVVADKSTPRPELKPRKTEVRVLPVQLKERAKEQVKSEPSRPAAMPEPVKPAPAPAKPADVKATEAKATLAKAAEVKPIEVKPAEVPAAPLKVAEPAKTAQPSKPAEPAKPVKTVAEAAPAPVAEKRPVPPAEELDTLGLPKLSFQQKETFWSRLPLAARLGAIAAVLALVIGGVVLTSRGSGSSKPASAVPDQPVMVEEPALAATAGWSQDWFVDRPGAKQGRHVDVLRGSLTLRDYRLLFEGQIEHGALGWVFRADNKSFYVEKIQVVTPGRDPVVALVHFAVINGQEQPRVQVPLTLQAHLDTMYKVRMDIVGDRFTTWVQDQQVDQWSDGQLSVGGVGLYYEKDDSAKLRDTLNVIPLKRK